MTQRLRSERFRRRRFSRVQVEQLEDRRLLSVAGLFHGGGVLHVETGLGSVHGALELTRVNSPTAGIAHAGLSATGIRNWQTAGLGHLAEEAGAVAADQGSDPAQQPPLVPPADDGQTPPVGSGVVTSTPPAATGDGTGTILQVESSSWTATVVNLFQATAPAPTTSAPSAAETTAVAAPAAPAVTPAETSTAAASVVAVTPAPAAPRATRPVISTSTTPDAPPVAVPTPVATAGEPVQAPSNGTPPPEHPGRLVAVNAPAHDTPVTRDTLTGGTAEANVPFALPRPAANTVPPEAPAAIPDARPAVPPTDRPPATVARPEGAAPGGTMLPERDGAAPQEADLLTDVPGSPLAGLGLGVRQAYQRLRNVLGDLADSVVVWRVAPVLTAALLGGTAYGIVRRRRKRRAALALPAGPGKSTDTWLPAPTDPPGVDQP